jgi:hypothetical protein
VRLFEERVVGRAVLNLSEGVWQKCRNLHIRIFIICALQGLKYENSRAGYVARKDTVMIIKYLSNTTNIL